jgi:formylglycine-generating enzyme required for sulfatase activity
MLWAVYAVQSADSLSWTNLWVDRTLLQAQGTSTVWTDSSMSARTQRFYRAVTVPAPTDTNLVFIQPGSFTMGSPTNEALRGADETQHTVNISRGFWIGKFLVTQAGYLAVIGTNPSYFAAANGYSDNPELPVERVVWFDATNYCGLRTVQERTDGQIPLNYAYRLPTESEWEYACRAGTTTAFYLGSKLSSGEANFNGQYGYDAELGSIFNPTGTYFQETTPVGNYLPNQWGLYDIIGNVWEWCQDWYGNYPSGDVTDPQGPEAGLDRVVRGGSWFQTAQSCRAAQRGYEYLYSTNFDTGFRVILAPVQP